MARAIIGALRAEMSANAVGFKKNLAEARRAAKSESRKMGAAFKRLKGVTTRLSKALFSLRSAAVIAAGSAAFGLLIKKSLDAADTIAKTADAAGISTDMLQELSHAANIAGIETAALQGAMTKFTKGIGEARLGTGTMVTILRKLDEELLNSLEAAETADEAFDIFIKAAADLENPMERAALFAAAFGRTAGTQMALLIKDGVSSLEDLRQEARDLGLVIDEDLLRGAEAANDALTRLGSSIKKRVIAAVLELAPIITELADRFTRGLPDLISWVAKFAEWIGLIEKAKAVQLAEQIKGLNAEIAIQREETERANRTWKLAAEAMDTIGPKTEEQEQRYKDLEGSAFGATTKLQMMELQLTALKMELAALLEPQKDHIAATDEQGEAAGEAAGEVGKLTDAEKALNRELKGTASALSSAITKGDDLGDVFKKLGNRIEEAVIEAVLLQAALKLLGVGTGAAGAGGLVALVAGIGKKILGFQGGGSFIVGGSGGPDSQLVAFRATPGETVDVGASRQGGGVVNQFITISGPIDADWFREVAAPQLADDSRRGLNKLVVG